ncbi:MAG TPA: MBL fold metallo-hydrolase [Chryseolinea sp.]|nr:MBL fold metallo-hydrolase [Chryseolinea sp.]
MSGHKLIPAFSSGEELQSQIQDAKSKAGKGHFDIWWLGQSGFLIQWDGALVLFDPYLSDSLTKKYNGTDKPHVRMSELVIAPTLLNNIDIVSSSHNHTDHLDAETLKPILDSNPGISFVIPEANRAFVCDRLKCPSDFPIGLNDGEKFTLKGFTYHGVPAAHNTIERDPQGRCKFMGFVVEFGKWVIYHSGDTLSYDNIVDVLDPFKIDLAFLPINGNDPARGVAGNLNAREAAELGHALDVRLVIPHHYHMFEFNTADPHDFEQEANRLKVPYRVLKLGERLQFK